jgi:hypothetical protein
MFNQIKNKIALAAIAPIYAADTNIQIQSETSQFQPLQNLTVDGIISGGISIALVVVSVVFFFILVLGGLKWVTSGGDEKKVGEARSQITNALIGLAIVFAAWAIMNLIGRVFGITIIGNSLTIPTFQ